MEQILKFLRTSGIYFFGNIFMRIVGIIMLPIYTTYISPEEYGKYDLYVTIVTFLTSVLFLDIWNGIMRFMFDTPKKEDKEIVIFNGSCIFSISFIIFSLVLLIIKTMDSVPYLGWIYLYGTLMNFQNLFSYIVRAFGHNELYVKAGMISAIAIAILNYLMLKYLSFDYSSLFIASCIGFTINVFILNLQIDFFHIVRKKLFNKKLFMEMMEFSLPLCINSIAYWLLTGYNRIVIAQQLSFFDNGLFAVATKFTVGITLFTMCFQLAWQEMSYSHASNETKKEDDFYSKAINYYISLLCIGACLLIPLVYLFYPMLVAETYNNAKRLVPLAILGACASAISVFLGNIFGAIKKTKYLFITLVISCSVNIILLYSLIPYYGIQAANIALLVGFVVNSTLRVIILKNHITISIRCIDLLVLMFVYGIVSCLCVNGSIQIIISVFFVSLVFIAAYYRKAILLAISYIRAKYQI